MVIRRGRSNNHRLDRVRICTSLVKQLLHSLGHHKGCTHAFFWFQDVASFHANALHDPFIAGFNDCGHLLIVEDIRRNPSTYTSYNSIKLSHKRGVLLDCSFLNNSHLATIVTARRAYCVIYVEFTTVWTNCQCWSYCYVMSSSLSCTSL